MNTKLRYPTSLALALILFAGEATADDAEKDADSRRLSPNGSQSGAGAGRDEQTPFEVSARREQSVRTASPRTQYEITMGGTVDMDNTMTRRYENFGIAFQPNISLEIANTGDEPVVNPRVVINNRGRWWSIDAMLDEILAGACDDQEKALLIWDFVRKNRYHDMPLFVDDELHDPVRFLGIYGGGLCDDSAAVGCSLFYHAGLNKTKYGHDPKTRHLHGHVMCEAFLDGQFQFLDIDEHVFYLDRDNERIVSGDELARDHDLAKREHAYGPIFQGWDVGETAAALFGSDDGAGFRAVAGHRLDITLRPGERLIYRWDHIGKLAGDSRSSAPQRRYFGNSRLVYRPRLDRYQHDADSTDNVVLTDAEASGDASLASATGEAEVVYALRSPYVMCGGKLEAQLLGKDPNDRFRVSFSRDGEQWNELWTRAGRGPHSCEVELDPLLETGQAPPKYGYLVRVSLDSAGSRTARLCDLTLAADLMVSPLSLPRLQVGTNQVVYTDETERAEEEQDRHEVTITHRWRESDNVKPPAAPGSALFPENDSVVRDSTFAFRWSPVPDADRYQLMVSRRADMRLAYRPAFDVVVERAEHGSPFTGMFNPDTDYYWRVRARNQAGVWGPWSSVWRFSWQGPRPPMQLEYQQRDGGEIAIRWKPDRQGEEVDHYRVFGSNERGFTVSESEHHVKGLGKRPSNLLGTTDGTEMVVVSAEPDQPNMNRSFYRVVAVDARGVASGPSDYVELPHPYVFAPHEATAVVDEPFQAELKTLKSIGDLQHRYAEPTQQYWEREAYEFKLVSAPDWLQLDNRSGLLSGTPGPDDVGASEVEVVVRRRYHHEVPPSATRGHLFQKDAPRFQGEDQHTLQLRVLEPSRSSAEKRASRQ